MQLESVLSQRNAASTSTPASEASPTAAPSGVSSQNVDEDVKLARALPSSLTSVTLNFKDYMDIIDEGIQVLARVLPSGLANLSVNFKGCADIIERAATTSLTRA